MSRLRLMKKKNPKEICLENGSSPTQRSTRSLRHDCTSIVDENTTLQFTSKLNSISLTSKTSLGTEFIVLLFLTWRRQVRIGARDVASSESVFRVQTFLARTILVKRLDIASIPCVLAHRALAFRQFWS